MSQAATIYRYLVESDNPAADRALALGLGRAEGPYDDVLLESILDRGRAESTAVLIEQYHSYPLMRKKVIAGRVEDLYSGLYRAYRQGAVQTRLNVLDVLGESGYVRLAHIPAELLTDSNGKVAQKAADFLISMARVLAKDRFKLREFGEEGQAGPCEQIRDRRVFLSAIQKAAGTYRIHHRPEAVLAAMMLVHSDASGFWKELLEPYHPVCKAVGSLMMGYSLPDVAEFVVSGLKHATLRASSVRAISSAVREDYVGALADAYAAFGDESIAAGLKQVRQLRWLDSDVFDAGRLTEGQQEHLVRFVVSSGVEEQAKASWLSRWSRQAPESAAHYAVESMSMLEEGSRVRVYTETIFSPHEPLAVRSLRELIRLNPPRLNLIMARQVNSAHPRVSQLARDYFQQMAFERYWDRFGKMSAPQRERAGRAIFKIDPTAHQRWVYMTRDHRPGQRLRSIQMARQLGRVEQGLAEIVQMTRDSDSVVRSCAVAALGELHGAGRKEVEQCLLRCLRDTDDRVRANAVESLEKQSGPVSRERIAELVQDGNNRVRANAIKAMLDWKVGSANRAIREMFADPRPAHRNSARWVMQTVSEAYSSPAKVIQERSKDVVLAGH